MGIDRKLAAIPAKSDHVSGCWLPLWLHSLDTTKTLIWLFENWLPECERLAMFPGEAANCSMAVLKTLGMLHDIGKATPVFAAHIAQSSQMPELIENMERKGFPPFWPREYVVAHAAAGEMLLKFFGAEDSLASARYSTTYIGVLSYYKPQKTEMHHSSGNSARTVAVSTTEVGS